MKKCNHLQNCWTPTVSHVFLAYPPLFHTNCISNQLYSQASSKHIVTVTSDSTLTRGREGKNIDFLYRGSTILQEIVGRKKEKNKTNKKWPTWSSSWAFSSCLDFFLAFAAPKLSFLVFPDEGLSFLPITSS